MKTCTLFLILLSQSLRSANPAPVDVAEGTLKIGSFGDEVFYFGFAEGDEILFSFSEVNGKELKEIEITELPSSVKFMDYKTKKIESKSLKVSRTGIYKFRFSNSAITGRICRFKVQRIPAKPETQNFNTSVYWKTIYDTTYTPVEESYLLRSDTSAVMVTEQVSKVSSQNAMNGNSNRSLVDFTLPPGTVLWSYYIGVGSEGKKAYDAAKDKFISTSAAAISRIPGYGALAALALQGINFFGKTPGGDNVKYRFIRDWENVQAFLNEKEYYQYKQGDVVSDASQMRSPLSGKIYLGLINDNIRDAIEVTVKISAIRVDHIWAKRTVNKMHVNSHEEAYLKN